MKLAPSGAISVATLFALVLATPSAYADSAPVKRIVIHSQSELPAYSYKITTPTVSQLLDDNAALLALAEAQRKDAEATLAKYAIDDRATLRSLYGVIRDAALLRGDATQALDYSAKVRDLADKPAEKLTSGLRADAAVAAMVAGADLQQRKAAFQNAFAASINPLPWNVVRDDVTQWNGQFETPNAETVMRGQIQGNLDPIVKQSGQLSADNASWVINTAIYMRRIEPYVAQASAVLGAYIKAHKQARPDIWEARGVKLDGSAEKLTPVVVAIWDEGVDTSLFPGRLFTNSAEKANGKDDDGNGFIDDIHGIGYDEDDNPVSGTLIPFDARYPGRETEFRELNIGRNDKSDGVDSAAAKAYTERASKLKPEEVPPLVEAALLYSYYAHGTHVAGIAMDSNPAARLMVIRANESGYRAKPVAFTPQFARRWATHIQAIVDYMKTHDVRVVNLSWGDEVAYIESTLEANGIGKTPAERRKIALEAFTIESEALTTAFRNAPDILFVPGAGNSNSDVAFARFIPADIDLPNALTAGAVDQAGDEAAFTSYGDRVRIYTNGFQVDSMVPGGSHMRMSGTSMAAPQVTNLAAKLFALDPKLTPTEVIKLILDGATKSADGKRLLINPKASVALLEAKH